MNQRPALDRLEVRVLEPALTEPLAEFFEGLAVAGADRFFHPHPLTRTYAGELARYTGDDLYVVLLANGRVVGYGMLRGWDEGFSRPSLGIAISPTEARKGLGRFLMNYLHVAARRRGAEAVRLKVFPDNSAALRLYSELGYEFSDSSADGQLIGTIAL